MLRALLITIILFTGSVSFAQTCSIIASNIVCKEELMSFDVTASSGIQSVLWDMGDATTSTQQSFSHKYSAKGIKTVKVTIKLTAGGTCITTKQITVYELPKLKILNITGTKNCLLENNICLVDSSSGGDSGIKIKKRIVIWDDGDQTVTTMNACLFLIIGAKRIPCEVASANRAGLPRAGRVQAQNGIKCCGIIYEQRKY